MEEAPSIDPIDPIGASANLLIMIVGPANLFVAVIRASDLAMCCESRIRSNTIAKKAGTCFSFHSCCVDLMRFVVVKPARP